MIINIEFVENPYWDAFLKEMLYFFGFMLVTQILTATCIHDASKVDSMHAVALNLFKVDSKVKQLNESDWNLKLDKQIARRRAYFGIPSAILPPCFKNVCGISSMGITEANIADFWFYVYNNHSFVSLFLASAVTRIPNINRRLNFVFVGVFAFTCYGIVSELPPHLKYTINYLVLMPLQFLIDGILHRLLNMGCINCLKRHCCASIIGYAIQFVIRMAAVVFILLCIFSSSFILADKSNLLLNFFWEYHFVSLIVEVLVIARKFQEPKWYKPETLCCCITTGVGAWYRQKAKYAHESEHGSNTIVVVANPIGQRTKSCNGAGVQMKNVV